MRSSLQSEFAADSKSRHAELVRRAGNWKKAIFAERLNSRNECLWNARFWREAVIRKLSMSAKRYEQPI
jgi:hypothetical protein